MLHPTENGQIWGLCLKVSLDDWWKDNNDGCSVEVGREKTVESTHPRVKFAISRDSLSPKNLVALFNFAFWSQRKYYRLNLMRNCCTGDYHVRIFFTILEIKYYFCAYNYDYNLNQLDSTWDIFFWFTLYLCMQILWNLVCC